MTPLVQFTIVAGAHFLALLSPGPDFFLIARSAIRRGLTTANAVCAGVAAANGVYIGLALIGFTLLQEADPLFEVIRWAGCLYLGGLGVRCLLAKKGVVSFTETGTADAPLLLKELVQGFSSGFLSAILNPKNSLFYASLFSILASTGTSPRLQIGYGIWMFTAVLLWDLAIARALSHPVVVTRFLRQAHHVERFTGVVLLGIAGLMLR